MSSTDFLGLNEHKIIQNVRQSLPKNISKALNVLTVKDDVLYTWDFQNLCVLTLNIKAARDDIQKDIVMYQKLLPLSPPVFSPELIVANERGTLLIIAGPGGVLIFELPSRCPPYGAFNNNKELVYCRTHRLDERLLACSQSVEVLQVKFHPGSIRDNHIVVLTSDNTLRLYIIENEVRNVGVYSVGEKPLAKVPCSRITFLGALGEIAVDFDFGHPEINKDNDSTPMENSHALDIVKQNQLEDTIRNLSIQSKSRQVVTDEKKYSNFNWPVYVLSGDFVIVTINIPLYSNHETVVRGPIPLLPRDVVQYDKKACSILCINSTPQVICIGNSNGEIMHGVVLTIDDEKLTKIKQNSNVSSGYPDREIHFFEIMEIELGLATTLSHKDEGYTCPIFLHKDESRCDRYFATHSTGVHVVSMPCLDELQEFVANDQKEEANSDVRFAASIAEYLVCTKTASSKLYNPVIGFSVFYYPNAIIALLANGNLVSLGLISTRALPQIERLSIKEQVVDSPLKDFLKAPFEQYIQKILKQTDTQPILKLSRSTEHTQKECYELLQKASQLFRDNHFKCHTLAREEIEQRIKALTMLHEYQVKQVASMNQEKQDLQDKAEYLAEKYEDIKDKQDLLIKRCEKLLILVSHKREILSNAETDYLLELSTIKDKLAKYDKTIDKLMVKKTYQENQRRNWKSQQEKKYHPINDTHRDTIKNNLVDTSRRINEMIDEIKEYKIQLHLK